MRAVTLPPLSLALALALWGWSTGLLMAALPLALALEARRFTTFQLELRDRDVGLVFDLCLLLTAGAAVHLFLSPDDPPLGKSLLQWSPLLFAPLGLAHAYSRRRRLPLGALITLPGSRPSRPAGGPRVALLPLYGGLCLVAAAAANLHAQWYYPAIAVVVGLTLAANRPAGSRTFVWLLLTVVALGGGFLLQRGIDAAQQWARDWVANDRRDWPFHASTGIGEIGEIKFSREIVLRVQTSEPLLQPLLLMNSAYNFYNNGSWSATTVDFDPVTPQPPDSRTYRLAPTQGDLRKPVTIYQRLRFGAGMLALPRAAPMVRGLDVERLETTGFGAVRVAGGRAFESYETWMDGQAARLDPPIHVDLLTTRDQHRFLDAYAERLGLFAMPPSQAALTLTEHFRTTFGYSLRQVRADESMDPLEAFLTVTRSGHCEYFATALALLLRRLDVPTRYVLGYVVEEPAPGSELPENLYVARASHSHSWVVAWLDGAWRTLDPTPQRWLLEDSAPLSEWQWLQDTRAQLAFAFQRWRLEMREAGVRPTLLFIGVAAALFLAYRMWRRGGFRRRRREVVTAPREALFGTDSPFYDVMTRWAALWPRAPGEPVLTWASRVGGAPLTQLAQLHYQYRFDPRRKRAEALAARLQQEADALPAAPRVRQDDQRSHKRPSQEPPSSGTSREQG